MNMTGFNVSYKHIRVFCHATDTRVQAGQLLQTPATWIKHILTDKCSVLAVGGANQASAIVFIYDDLYCFNL